MRGIILAGGTGSRLWPVTQGVSKQLMPVYDKPMIYFPLSTLMAAGIDEVLVITTPEDQATFIRLLGDGARWGMRLEYAVQPKPEGLAQAFIIGAGFIRDGAVAFILGDNIFYGTGLGTDLVHTRDIDGGRVFGYHVANPKDYGVVEFDDAGSVLSIVERPEKPASSYAVPGLYFYDNDAVEIARGITPSARGELEITAVNETYLRAGRLSVSVLPRGPASLDTGSFTTLMQASVFARVIEDRQGLKIGCPEEVACRNGWISDAQLTDVAAPLVKSGYGRYLLGLLDEGPEPA